MGKVTEKIDLTLESLFAGDSFPNLKPAKWRHPDPLPRRFFSADGFMWHITHLVRMVHNSKYIHFLKQPEPDTTLFYLDVFGEFPPQVYDEMLGYGDPDICERCGRKTTPLNRNSCYDVCDSCESIFSDPPMTL